MKTQNPINPPGSVSLSKRTELCKGLLLFSAGYIFCYLFLLDYSEEGMNIFYRWSTTSYSQFKHPVLFAIWCLLCASSFFLNLDRLRRKYACRQKILAVLQYLGAIFLIITMLVPTHKAPHLTLIHYLKYYIHLFSAMFYALSNMACLMIMLGIKMKTDRRFRRWFIGCIITVVVSAFLFIFKLCGFVETAPTLMAFAALYILNYTHIMDPKISKKQQQRTRAYAEHS